ncbi:MAG: hypothetical protein K0T99_04675 [Alphaproteobacteria bacterium]|nr:hypothetical protein [Alphaproteobacteria bacterium]
MSNGKSTNPKLHQTIDKIIGELCAKHSSDNLEEDIIALFEDIIRFFSGREEDFIDFDSIPIDQKELIYNEIMTIINLLRKLGSSVDKHSAMTVLSKNLIATLSKKSKKLQISAEKISAQEQSRLKKEFSTITIQELYKERQKKLATSISPKDQNMNFPGLEEKVQEIMKSGIKFSDKFKKIDPKTRIQNSKGNSLKRS